MRQRWGSTEEQIKNLGYGLIDHPNDFSWKQANVAIYVHQKLDQLDDFVNYAHKFLSLGDHIILDKVFGGNKTSIYHKKINDVTPNSVFVYHKSIEKIPVQTSELLRDKLTNIVHIPLLTGCHTQDDLIRLYSMLDSKYAMIEFEPESKIAIF